MRYSSRIYAYTRNINLMSFLHTPTISIVLLIVCLFTTAVLGASVNTHLFIIFCASLVLIHASFTLVYHRDLYFYRSMHFNLDIPVPSSTVEQFFVMDTLSVWMYFLTALVFVVCFYYIAQNQMILRLWFIILLLLEILIILAFATNNLFVFIMCFEAIIMPMYILIFVFGSRGRRVHAAYYFFFYTFASSIFLFLGLFSVYNICGTFDFIMLSTMPIPVQHQIKIALLFFFGFAAKVPVCPFHIWLPEAHVESPTIGSVILASLLLKLGLYGLIRIVILFPEGCLEIRTLVWTMAAISVYYGTMLAIRAIDIKKIIAYSSIVHMNLSLAAVFSCDSIGIHAGYLSMFSHAFTSGALFLCAGMLYDRIQTRNVLYMSGQDTVNMRWFQRLFLFSVLSNMGAPFTCNFIAEIVQYIALAHINWIYCMVLVFNMLVLTSFYNLMLLYRVLYSKSPYFYYLIKKLNKTIDDLSFTDVACLLFFLSYTVLLGLNADVIGQSLWPWL